MKSSKRLENDIYSVKNIVKKLAAQESIGLLKKKSIPHSNESSEIGYEDAGLLLLSDELTSSLRTLKSKGCFVKSQVAHMISTGDANAKNSRRRRAFEKPHAGKKIKWVAKHKY